jgi:hypothetical protein
VIPFGGLALGRVAWHRARFVALVLVTLLAAHDAAYLVRFGAGAGYASAMTAGGHAYWDAFTVSGIALAVGLLGASLATLRRLRVAADPAAVDAASATGSVAYVAELAHLWPRLLGAVTAAYLLQEIAEHLLAFGHAPTPDELAAILGPASLAALAVVTFLVAAVGALVRWRIAILRARADVARSGSRRPVAVASAPAAWPITAALLRHAFLLVRLDAGRAPPRIVG